MATQEQTKLSQELFKTLAQLSPEQIDALTANLLAAREPGRQPLAVFLELARLSTIGTVEIAPIRDVNKTEAPQILLARRPKDDIPEWAGKWHLPGNVILARPQTKETVVLPMNVFADGVLKNEFEGVNRTGDFVMFDSHVRTGNRGTELTTFGNVPVDLAKGYEEPVGGRFFSFDTVREQLSPDDMISGHPDTLFKAMRAYKHR